MDWVKKHQWTLVCCVVLGASLWYVWHYNVNLTHALKWFNEYKPDINNVKTPELPAWKPLIKDKDATKSDVTPIPPQTSVVPKKNEKEDATYIPTISEDTWVRSFEAERLKS